MNPKGVDLLVLLSIYQSCEYRGISFLDFLLSGETDIKAFPKVSTMEKGGSSQPS